MIINLLLIIITILGGVYGYESLTKMNDLIDKILFTIVGLLIGFMIASLISISIVSLTTLFVDLEYEEINEQKILALNGNFETEGNFFLGTGNLEENLKYYYLIKKDNGYKIKSIDTDNTLIYEDNNPRIGYYRGYFRNKILRFLLGKYSLKDYHKIYVPKGSIKYNFNTKPFN